MGGIDILVVDFIEEVLDLDDKIGKSIEKGYKCMIGNYILSYSNGWEGLGDDDLREYIYYIWVFYY